MHADLAHAPSVHGDSDDERKKDEEVQQEHVGAVGDQGIPQPRDNDALLRPVFHHRWQRLGVFDRRGGILDEVHAGGYGLGIYPAIGVDAAHLNRKGAFSLQ